jgi:ribonuclease VapC
MVIDSSALIAILLGEREAEAFASAIALDDVRICSAVSFLETSIVIETRRGDAGLTRLDLLIAEATIEIIPFSLRDARVARKAYRQFGKGIHPAGLNFGDCASYALALETGEPLLYKGEDFAKTGIPSAIRA